MEQSIASRLEELKTHLGFLSAGKFADHLKIGRSNYSQYLNGKRVIGDGIINKICLTTHVSKKWLTTGMGGMFDQEPMVIDHCKGVTKRDTLTDTSLLIDLLARQQKHVEELSEELDRKNALIDELREQLNQTHS